MWLPSSNYNLFGVWFIAFATGVSPFMGESLVVDWVYWSRDCPHGRIGCLGRLNYFRYDIFGVFLEHLKYFSGYICTTLLIRTYRRAYVTVTIIRQCR